MRYWTRVVLVLTLAVLLVAEFLLSFAGCGPRRQPYPTAQISTVTITWGNPAPSDPGAALAAISSHVDAYEAVWGPVPPVRIEVYGGRSAPVGACGQSAGCMHDSGSGYLWAGVDNTCTLLPHELHHRLIWDPGHTDSSWPGVDAMGKRVSGEILAARAQ